MGGGVEVISYLCISSRITRTEAITVILEKKVTLQPVIAEGNFSGWDYNDMPPDKLPAYLKIYKPLKES